MRDLLLHRYLRQRVPSRGVRTVRQPHRGPNHRTQSRSVSRQLRLRRSGAGPGDDDRSRMGRHHLGFRTRLTATSVALLRTMGPAALDCSSLASSTSRRFWSSRVPSAAESGSEPVESTTPWFGPAAAPEHTKSEGAELRKPVAAASAGRSRIPAATIGQPAIPAAASGTAAAACRWSRPNSEEVARRREDCAHHSWRLGRPRHSRSRALGIGGQGRRRREVG